MCRTPRLKLVLFDGDRVATPRHRTAFLPLPTLYLLPDLRSVLIFVACNRQQDLARKLSRLSAAAHCRPMLQSWWGYCGAISTSSNAFADYNMMKGEGEQSFWSPTQIDANIAPVAMAMLLGTSSPEAPRFPGQSRCLAAEDSGARRCGRYGGNWTRIRNGGIRFGSIYQVRDAATSARLNWDGKWKSQRSENLSMAYNATLFGIPRDTPLRRLMSHRSHCQAEKARGKRKASEQGGKKPRQARRD
ncbi:hypothetical protein B0H14DRAFT_2577874 [Mycena olivaceomarginata]|nr:hypothetical protein B0H14DRAFT_2577874 [Mycena olivaceomarginata]